MNPIRKRLTKWGLLPITPDDLAALLDQAQDKALPQAKRFAALIEYALFAQTPERVDGLLDTLYQMVRHGGPQCT
ncbi:MAG: hypothetical protein JXA89_24180 [Anaerolineae bacterium]|nr:hypothetical protein [Anaerolineae bacterium]